MRFKKNRYQTIEKIEETHFWFIGRRKILRYLLSKYLDKKIEIVLDVGCGTGYNYNLFSENTISKYVGIDQWADQSNLKFNDNKFFLIAGDVNCLPLDAESVDIVLALDIFEHVDDNKISKEIFRVLKPNGVLLATVPAFNWMWSHRDNDAGHLRRYTRKAFKKLIENNGMEVVFSNFYQFFLFPISLISRLLMGKKSRDIEDIPPRPVNFLFNVINSVEFYLLKSKVNFAFGTSIILVAKK